MALFRPPIASFNHASAPCATSYAPTVKASWLSIIRWNGSARERL